MTDAETVTELERLDAEIEALKRAGAVLMQAAVRKVNKPAVGTMTHDPATGKFRRVDAMVIDAVKAFGKLLGISVGEETETEALDRRAKDHGHRIEVVPHDPDGPQSKEDVRGCERKNNFNTQSGSGTSD